MSLFLSYLGIGLLYTCLLTSVLQITIAKQVNSKLLINSLNLSLVQFISCMLSFLILIYVFLNSDFNFQIVFLNSHTAKPFIYKFSGTWGNHEGSLLMWVLILTIFNFSYSFFSNSNKKLKNMTIAIQSFLIIGFLLFLIFTSNPFLLMDEVPSEGLGLNPILQDPLLAIHPPLLYLGYVGFSLIFSLALAGLIISEVDKGWAAITRPWAFTAWIFLTSGIGLGSLWAYNELGWGGYWFWDPVENASLMPWLAGTALIHCIVVLEKRNTLQSWTILLSILTFALSLIGTFLVRSGILNSVHAFASDSSRGLFILAFLALTLFVSFIIYARNGPSLDQKIEHEFLSRETGILLNNWILLSILFVVFLGTLYPIFTEIVFGSSLSIGPNYFIISLMPFVFILLISMILTPFVGWGSGKFKHIITNIQKPLLLSTALIFSLSIYYEKLSITEISLLILSSTLIASSLKDKFILSKKIFSISTTLGRSLTHAGFGLLIISIIANSAYSTEKIFQSKVNDILNISGNQFVFTDVKQSEAINYNAIQAFFELRKNDKTIEIFTPEIRFYSNPPTVTSETSISHQFFKDIYIVMNIPENQEYINVRIHIKPFMNFIWFSIMMMICGGTVSAITKRRNY